VKLTMLKDETLLLLFSENPEQHASAILSQYARVADDRRQTSYDNSRRTLPCNCNVGLNTSLHSGPLNYASFSPLVNDIVSGNEL